MAVYLIHFSRPMANGHHPQHYLGYTPRDPVERLQDHIEGRNRPARILQAALEEGITLEISRVWANGTPQDEKELKAKKRGFAGICPACTGGEQLCL